MSCQQEPEISRETVPLAILANSIKMKISADLLTVIFIFNFIFRFGGRRVEDVATSLTWRERFRMFSTFLLWVSIS
jgi:hypothetical protein